jgi:hypothetical protein
VNPTAVRETPGTTARAVQRLIAARFLGLLADQMSTYLIPVVIYATTGSVQLSGLAFAVQWLPRVMALPVLGVLVDRFPIRRQFLVNDLARAGVLLVVAVVAEPVALMAASAVMTLLNGHAVIATETVLARCVPSPLMPDAQSRVQVAQQLSFTAGPALGGALLLWPGLSGGVVLIAGVLVVAAVATFAALRSLEVRRSPVAGSPLRNLVDGARVVLGSKPLMSLVSLTVIVNLVAGLALGALPVIVVGDFDAAPSMTGVVAGAASVMSLVAALLTKRLLRRTSIGTVVAGAGVALVASGPAMALAPTLVVFTVAYVLWTAGVTVFTIWLRTRRLDYLPADAVGGALGFFVAAVLAATPVAGVLLSLFGTALGAQHLMLIMCGVSAVLAVPAVFSWIRSARTRRNDFAPTSP